MAMKRCPTAADPVVLFTHGSLGVIAAMRAANAFSKWPVSTRAGGKIMAVETDRTWSRGTLFLEGGILKLRDCGLPEDVWVTIPENESVKLEMFC